MHHLSIDTEVIGIDESQLFHKEYTLNVVNSLLRMGITVVCSGLDMTYEGKPFGVMPYLMAIADEVNKLHAVCEDCGEDAYISYRINSCTDEVQIGGKDSYIALCRQCYYKRLNRDNK
jgi:thymidine kinase